MIKDDSAQVNEFFEANSRDLTPAPVRHAAQVLYAPVSRDPGVTRRCASVLVSFMRPLTTAGRSNLTHT
jgi:hypothetical protein